MKFEIEESDIQEVQRIAIKYYGVSLTPDQAKYFIESNLELVGELLYGGLDTQGREILCDCMVEKILGNSWEWPLNSSSDQYKEEFYTQFKRSAIEKGYELDKKYWKL